jgi:hypothetical protein
LGSNECIILLGAVKQLIISFGALTAIIFTTAKGAVNELLFSFVLL